LIEWEYFPDSSSEHAAGYKILRGLELACPSRVLYILIIEGQDRISRGIAGGELTKLDKS
jgi:hypothetical protein